MHIYNVVTCLKQTACKENHISRVWKTNRIRKTGFIASQNESKVFPFNWPSLTKSGHARLTLPIRAKEYIQEEILENETH